MVSRDIQGQEVIVPVAPGSKADLFLRPSSKKVQGLTATVVSPIPNTVTAYSKTSEVVGDGSGDKKDDPVEQGDRPKLEDIEIVEPPIAKVDANGIPYWEYTVYVKNTSTNNAVDVDIERAKSGTQL